MLEKLKVYLDAHRPDRIYSRWLVENDIRQQGPTKTTTTPTPGVEGPEPARRLAASATGSVVGVAPRRIHWRLLALERRVWSWRNL